MTYNKSQFRVDEDEAFRKLSDLIDQYELECADNHRVFKKGDEEGSVWFTMRRESGCCGCFETTVEVNGSEWVVGCNYGH